MAPRRRRGAAGPSSGRLLLALVGVTFAAVEELANVQRFMEDDVSDRDRREACANADLGWPVAADHTVRNATLALRK